MQNDKTTLYDLAVFTSDGTGGVFNLIDRTTTQAGRDMLRRFIYHPPDTYAQLVATQQAVAWWAAHQHHWPGMISNGTIVMLEKFFESADNVAAPASGVNLLIGSFFQKVLNKQEYFLTQFSISHLADFLKGCTQLAALAQEDGLPTMLVSELEQIAGELKHRLTDKVMRVTTDTRYADLVELNYHARREMKNMVFRLINAYARLDAWQAMGAATVQQGWVFPQVVVPHEPCMQVQGLFHPLVATPVAYDTRFGEQQNFLVLTGANMSGKTTFMRALGLAALLAHLGMGVPCASMRISFLYGIITNMHVEDNILKGESYFFAEVQRMKQTATKLLDPKPHLVLMDELFKGTNVHDAYECTRAVIDGLLNRKDHLMVLSTHLYEVAHLFSDNGGIQFAHFVTHLSESGYRFTYELKGGISNDRIGYRILLKEGVIDLLSKKNNH